jgi:simple sugar transport system permease protein
MSGAIAMDPSTEASALSQQLKRFARRPEFGALGALIAVYILFAFATRGAGFVGASGTVGWLNQAAELGIIAVPIGLLMVAGEFDLSIGSVVAAAGMIVAVGSNVLDIPIWFTIAMAIGVGALVGLANGLMVVGTGLPSFIVTLATNFIVAGATLGVSRLIAGTSTVSVPSSRTAHAVFAMKFGDANIAILWWIIVVAIGSWVLAKSAFGNWIYATGGNRDFATAAGVPTSFVKQVLFVCTGMAAALVGVIIALEFNSGNAAAGQSFVFEAPVVCVIGGIALSGGYGSGIGVLIGTVIFGVISVGIYYTGWNTEWIGFFLGVLLLLAVLTNNYFRNLALRSA